MDATPLGIAASELSVTNAMALTGRASFKHLTLKFAPPVDVSSPVQYLNLRGMETNSMIEAGVVSVSVVGARKSTVQRLFLFGVRVKHDGLLRGRWAARTILAVNSMEHTPYMISLGGSKRVRVYNTLFD